jgi:hypothetical protein
VLLRYTYQRKCYLDTHKGGARPGGQCAQRAIAEAKQHSQRSVIGWVTKIYYLELLRASKGTLRRWSQLHLQSLAPTNPHWACVASYPCVIHKKGPCPSSSGDINRPMMMIKFNQCNNVPLTKGNVVQYLIEKQDKNIFLYFLTADVA